MSSSPPPSALRVVLTVVWVLTARAVSGLGSLLRGVASLPRNLTSRLRVKTDASTPSMTPLPRRAAATPGPARSLRTRVPWGILGALSRRVVLLGALAALALVGGDLLAARPPRLLPPGPEVFLVGFALCGALCLVAPERRLRWSSLAVGSAHGMFAALTFFGGS